MALATVLAAGATNGRCAFQIFCQSCSHHFPCVGTHRTISTSSHQLAISIPSAWLNSSHQLFLSRPSSLLAGHTYTHTQTRNSLDKSLQQDARFCDLALACNGCLTRNEKPSFIWNVKEHRWGARRHFDAGASALVPARARGGSDSLV